MQKVKKKQLEKQQHRTARTQAILGPESRQDKNKMEDSGTLDALCVQLEWRGIC